VVAVADTAAATVVAVATAAEVVTAINSQNCIPASFGEFIALDCDRKQFILDYLSREQVKASVITLPNDEHVEHIVVQFSPSAYNPLFHIKTILVHYDRAAESPGANDNSAAVFQAMDWAVRLNRSAKFHNVRLIFTDGEELTGNTGVTAQGAFAVAQRLKSLGIVNEDVYVFDCTGRGDVLVLSKAGLTSSANGTFNRRFTDLYRRTEDLLSAVSPEAWFTLPVPYSDNAGFLACGIPAVCITILPSTEVSAYLLELRRDKTLETKVLTKGHSDPLFHQQLPLTWQLLHSKDDAIPTLTPRAWALMAKLLDRLGGELRPV
jgi:hypothetical protein